MDARTELEYREKLLDPHESKGTPDEHGDRAQNDSSETNTAYPVSSASARGGNRSRIEYPCQVRGGISQLHGPDYLQTIGPARTK
jgi:hypothetical protein